MLNQHNQFEHDLQGCDDDRHFLLEQYLHYNFHTHHYMIRVEQENFHFLHEYAEEFLLQALHELIQVFRFYLLEG
jgi:nicotinic acid phosphoribosyltransferase